MGIVIGLDLSFFKVFKVLFFYFGVFSQGLNEFMYIVTSVFGMW